MVMTAQVQNGVDKVRVSGVPYLPVVLVEQNRERKFSGAMLVRIEAPPEVKSSCPVDLVVVLDVSGSMARAAKPPAKRPSKLDLLKKAMKFIIRQLHEDDRLAIVAFNDKVVTEYSTDILENSSSGRKSAEKKVDELEAKGDTAFQPGLEHAVKILDDRADNTRLGFILLLSDGLDNSKFKWNEESIASSDPVRGLLGKYPIHTFGLCTAHDPQALLFIAKASNGTYSSVTDNLNSRIMEAFGVCLAGLKTIVAVDVCVDIKIMSSGWKLIITRIDSGGYNRNISTDGTCGNIMIGVLYPGELKDIIVYFDLSMSGFSSRIYYHPTLSAGVEYKDVPTRQPISTDRNTLSTLISSTPAGFNHDEKLVFPFPKVLQQMVRFKVLDFLVNFLKEFDALKVQAESASDSENCYNRVVQTIAGNMLHKKWEEFEKSDETWIQGSRAFVDLRGIEKDIKAMVSILKQGLGVGCVYSWVSAYQMQRATTTGLPNTAFLTPAMEEMLHEAHKQLAEDVAAQVVHDKDKDAAPSPDNAPPAQPGKEGGPAPADCKRAVELLDGIDERFEQWCKLDRGVPPTFHPSPEQEGEMSLNLATVLREDISRAMQHDIYLAAVHTINQWRSSCSREKPPHSVCDKYAHEAPPGSHHKRQNPESGDAESNAE